MRLKLCLMLAIFAAVPTLLLGGYQAWVSYNSLVDDAKTELSRSSQSRSEGVRRYFERVCLDVEAMAQVKEIDKLIEFEQPAEDITEGVTEDEIVSTEES